MGTLRKITEYTEEKKKVHKRLTIAELRNFKGFENYSDERAEKTIQTLETLSILFFKLFQREKLRRQCLTILKGGKYELHQRTAA